MFSRLNIGEKLALLLIGFTLLVTLFLTTSYYLQFNHALRDRVLLQLSSVKQLKKLKTIAELQDHLAAFNRLRSDSSYRTHDDFLITVKSASLPDSLAGFRLPDNLDITSTPQLIDLTLQQSEKRGIIVMITATMDSLIMTSIVRLPEIQEILLERTGLGETGETYLVDSDYRLITNSRFDSLDWRKIKVQTRGVIEAFEGRAGTDVFLDYRNIKVLGAFEKIDFHGINWVILSEINFSEAMAPLTKLRNDLLYIFLIILVFILIVSYYLSKVLVSPIITMQQQLIRLSKGELDVEVPGKIRSDEIGHMFDALKTLIDAVSNTVVFAGEIGNGNFDAEYTLLGSDDKLGKALLQMKEQLQEFKINEARLLKENQQSIIEGQEKERSRLSKELHDGMGPLLTTLRMQVQSTEIENQVKINLLKQLDHTIAEVRRMSNNLMPSVLEDFGAGEAINNLVEQINNSTSIIIRYKNDTPDESRANKNTQIALYRITQEAINNAIKHSGCSEIRISLSEFDEYIGLFISDNGTGFDASISHSGSGLRNMKERVHVINGNIDIISDNSGTTIEIEIPIT